MDLKDGIAAVKAARQYAEAETKGRGVPAEATDLLSYIDASEQFSEVKGAFVTISLYPSGDLRGCIGYPEPRFPLRDVLEMSAKAACHDPRFFDLTYEETNKCTFEVTIMTKPERIEYNSLEDLLSKIVIGRDGLILEFKGRRGLLLPQVPVEFGWNAEEFMEHLSVKAGLAPTAWRDPGVVMESFSGEIFSEASPRGEVVRK